LVFVWKQNLGFVDDKEWLVIVIAIIIVIIVIIIVGVLLLGGVVQLGVLVALLKSWSNVASQELVVLTMRFVLATVIVVVIGGGVALVVVEGQ